LAVLKIKELSKTGIIFHKQKVTKLGQPSGGIIRGENPLVKEKTRLIFFVLSIKKIVYLL
jgi:hypothetical protein